MHKENRDHWLWWLNSPLCQGLQTSVFAAVLFWSIKANLDVSDQPNWYLWEKQLLIFPFNGVSYNLVPRSGAAGVANKVVACFNTCVDRLPGLENCKHPQILSLQVIFHSYDHPPPTSQPSLPTRGQVALSWGWLSTPLLRLKTVMWLVLQLFSLITMWDFVKGLFLWGTFMAVSNRGTRVFHYHEHLKQLYSFCIRSWKWIKVKGCFPFYFFLAIK